MPPEECREVEHQQNIFPQENISSVENSNSFAQEVVREALGDTYTEHVKITLKSDNNIDKLSAFVFNEQSDMKTFKQTYFGASKSQSYDENLFKNVKNEEIATASVEQGRTIFLIIILGNPSNIILIISNTNLKKNVSE